MSALALINRSSTFPLLDHLKLAKSIETYTGLAVYSARAMGIDIEALVYYALSLAWRGAVEEWKTLKGSNNYSLSRLLRGANPPKPRGTRVPTWRKTAPLEVD